LLAIDFAQFASQLAQDTSLGPVEYRSAVSRAYYGAFHSAQAFLRNVKIAMPSSHGAVWQTLISCQDQALMIAGSDLQDLHSNRRRADYDLNDLKIETQKNARSAVSKAFTVMTALTTCLNDLTRTAQVQRNLAAWVRMLPPGSGYKILP
jgi:uncharacterized protein (UPF0332 family)